MQIPHVETFIKQGVYLCNWTPRTVRTYRQGLAALDSVSPRSCRRPRRETLEGITPVVRDCDA
jgi:hypothetical protein